MGKIQWKRSNDGFVDSKCGKWVIVPLYCGSTRAQFFELKHERKTITRMASSQREAKEDAERWLEEQDRKRAELHVVRDSIEALELREVASIRALSEKPGPQSDMALLEAALKYGARQLLSSPRPLSTQVLADVVARGFAALLPPSEDATAARPAPAPCTRESDRAAPRRSRTSRARAAR